MGLVKSGGVGAWETGTKERFSLPGMPQMPWAWALQVQRLPWCWHGESWVAAGEFMIVWVEGPRGTEGWAGGPGLLH